MKFWKWLISLWKKPQPKPEPEKPSSSDAIDIKAIKWLGITHINAERTIELEQATISDEMVTYLPAAPSYWPTKVVKVLVQARTCVFYDRNGITGGFYEWSKPGDMVRSTHNLHTGYQGHSMPAKGSKVWVMLVSVDGKLRSNIIEATWK